MRALIDDSTLLPLVEADPLEVRGPVHIVAECYDGDICGEVVCAAVMPAEVDHHAEPERALYRSSSSTPLGDCLRFIAARDWLDFGGLIYS